MKIAYCTILIFHLFFAICFSQKKETDLAIQIAVKDFLHAGKLIKEDSVFDISITNTSDDVLGVSIFGSTNKLLPTSKNIVGTSYKGFPTNYIEEGNKLFYWYDSTKNITADLIAELSRYKLIDSLNVNGFVGIPDALRDDSKKAAHYYFCKCNLQVYKKVYTNHAMGWYDPPKVSCFSK
jgi:hypothetical protein